MQTPTRRKPPPPPPPKSEDDDLKRNRNKTDWKPSKKRGDTPIISPFALSRGFWRSMAFAVVAGIFMGFVGLGFLNIVEWVPLQWWGKGYGDTGATLDYLHGKPYWMGIMAGAGLIVGVIRVATNAPDQFDGFFVEVQNRHSEPKHALQAVAISAVSLTGGVSMGPEAALVACGGAFGVWSARMLKHSIRRQKQYAVIGMVAACGALFPTPFLALLIVHELGKPDDHFMENAMLTGTAATISFAIFFALKDETWLEMGELKIGAHVVFGDLKIWDLGIAALIGVFGGILGTIYLIMMGLCRGIGDRCRARVGKSIIGRILVPTIFGFLLGAIGYIAPLTLGSGMEQIKMIMILHWNGELGTPVLMGTVFLKCLTYGLSVGGGFVGGIFFPTVFMGACLGLALNSYDEKWFPLVLSVSCSLAAVPGSFCPCPFTILTLVQSLLIMGSYEVAPIFVTLIFSYLTLMGVGIIWQLQSSLVPERKNNLTQKQDESDEEVAKGAQPVDPNRLKVNAKPIRLLNSVKEDISFLGGYASATESIIDFEAEKNRSGLLILRTSTNNIEELRDPLLLNQDDCSEWSLMTANTNMRNNRFRSSIVSTDEGSGYTVEDSKVSRNSTSVA